MSLHNCVTPLYDDSQSEHLLFFQGAYSAGAEVRFVYELFAETLLASQPCVPALPISALPEGLYTANSAFCWTFMAC